MGTDGVCFNRKAKDIFRFLCIVGVLSWLMVCTVKNANQERIVSKCYKIGVLLDNYEISESGQCSSRIDEAKALSVALRDMAITGYGQTLERVELQGENILSVTASVKGHKAVCAILDDMQAAVIEISKSRE